MKLIFQTATKDGEHFINFYHVASYIGKIAITDAELNIIHSKDVSMYYEDNPTVAEVSKYLREAFDYILELKKNG